MPQSEGAHANRSGAPSQNPTEFKEGVPWKIELPPRLGQLSSRLERGLRFLLGERREKEARAVRFLSKGLDWLIHCEHLSSSQGEQAARCYYNW